MARCYDKDRNENQGLYPCDTDPDSDLKSCCSPGDSCASNGLCIAPLGKNVLTPYFINGCTKDDWDDPTCIQQCDQGNGVKPCGTGKFCCYGFNDCDCNNENVVFTLDPVKIVTRIPDNPTREDDATSSSTTSTTSSKPATTSSTTATEVTSTSQSASLATSTSTDFSKSSNDKGNDTTLSIGLGVGLGVGIALLVLGVGLVLLWRKRKRSRTEPQPYVAGKDTPMPRPVNASELHGQSRTAELP
ncbi:hypothetical protein F53441_7602 [Fusarium austroafricanum]|uniref:Mid2 domain-containing protein n=1 Tax=Fusarium austroafricanum TaxID=2364996 RepID=A0A8H4NXE7_9HYPO|nr:hypothetical protein F53441_7602 [Fusarium austroafricanum]